MKHCVLCVDRYATVSVLTLCVYLVEGSGEEGCEGGAEGHSSVSASGSDSHSHQVLLSNVTLHVPLGGHLSTKHKSFVNNCPSGIRKHSGGGFRLVAEDLECFL